MQGRDIDQGLPGIGHRGARRDRPLADPNDAKTQDAASKCAESIGLAANELSKLDSSLDREFPNLNLSLAYKSRNKLSHGYFAVEQEIVWNTVTVSIPQTVAAARQARLEYSGGNGTGGATSDKTG
jgi:uncharacterized protein with HEPN domain